MTDTLALLAAATTTAIATAVVASLATRFQLLPEVYDLSTIPTGAGLLGLLGAAYGALRGFPMERIGRLTLGGNLLGALLAALGLVIGVIAQ